MYEGPAVDSVCEFGPYRPPRDLRRTITFAFKFEDLKGRVHRVNCGTENIEELVSTVVQRIGLENDDRPQLLYEDKEGDKVLLTTDSDLLAAVNQAQSAGTELLKLHLDFSNSVHRHQLKSSSASVHTTMETKKDRSYLLMSVVVGAVAVTSIGFMVYLKRKKL